MIWSKTMVNNKTFSVLVDAGDDVHMPLIKSVMPDAVGVRQITMATQTSIATFRFASNREIGSMENAVAVVVVQVGDPVFDDMRIQRGTDIAIRRSIPLKVIHLEYPLPPAALAALTHELAILINDVITISPPASKAA
jgi:hypothetical protein